ncbi:hypothetical protein Tco_0116875 [Tanacetum coccineum]
MPEQQPSKIKQNKPLDVTISIPRSLLPACHSSLASCLSSLEESLPSVPDAYGQSLGALPSQLATSGSESHVPGAGSE